MFGTIVNELIYLVDNGAHIDRPVIAKILDEGRDVIQFLEYALPYKMSFSLLNADEDRDFYMELLCKHYSGGGREKHYGAKNNGLLFLIELCLILGDEKMFNEYRDSKIDYYLGKLTEEEMWKLKFIGVGYDEFVSH